jgi:hypothetical protein
MKKLLLVCVVVAVFAVAFVVGRLSAPDAFSSAGGGLLPGPGESLTTERVAVVVRETPVPAAEGVQAAENRGEPVEGEAEAVVAGQTRPAQEAILAAIGTPSPFVRELKLHALVQDIPASEMPALIAAFEAQPPKVRNEAQNLLLERWVELSPRAAVTWALAQKRKNPYDVPFLGKIFNTWAAVDPSRAAAAASALGEDKQRRVALQAVVNAVAQTDFRQARQLLDQHTDVLTDRWRYRSVFRPWAETDPQEAYREAMTLADVDHRWGAVNAVIDVWAKEDPHAALEAAMTAERGNERRNLIRTALKQMASVSPVEALEIYHSLPAGDVQDRTLREIYEGWAAREPEAALAHASENITSIGKLGDIYSEVVKDWYWQDRPAALAYLDAMEESPMKLETLRDLARSVSRDDPELAFDLIDRIPPGRARYYAITSVSRQIADKDADMAVQFVLANTQGSDRLDACRGLIWDLDDDNPQALVTMINAFPMGEGRVDLIESMAREWGEEDPAGAMAWINSLPNAYERSEAMKSYFRELSEDNPLEVMQMALTLDDEEVKSSALSSAMRNLSKYDPQQALQLIGTLDSEVLRQQAMQAVARGWGEQVPEDAAAWIDTLPEGQERNSVIDALANQWTWRDPAGAAAWLENLSCDSDVYRSVQQDVVNSWVRQDLPAAAAYMAEMSAGPGRDDAIRTLVNNVSHYEPAYAAEWSLRVQDEGQRRQLLNRSLIEWGKVDKFAARQFVLREKLSDDQRKEYLDMLK